MGVFNFLWLCGSPHDAVLNHHMMHLRLPGTNPFSTVRLCRLQAKRSNAESREMVGVVAAAAAENQGEGDDDDEPAHADDEMAGAADGNSEYEHDDDEMSGAALLLGLAAGRTNGQ
jgi:hypothetical protein